MTDHYYAYRYNRMRALNKVQIRAAATEAVKIASSHHLHYSCEIDGDGNQGEAYRLLDALTPADRTIDVGQEELALLVDSIIVDLLLKYEDFQWRPMDTAPKDGATILVYTAREGVQAAFYVNVHRYGNEPGWCAGFNWADTTMLEPICWRPLPEPPTSEAQKRLSAGASK